MRTLGLIFVGVFLLATFAVRQVFRKDEDGEVLKEETVEVADLEPQPERNGETKTPPEIPEIIKKIEPEYETIGIAPPGFMKASKGDSTDRVYITWDNVDNAERYYVYRTASPDGNYKEIGKTAQTDFIDETVEPNIKYYYRVKAWSGKLGFSNFSSTDRGNSSKTKLQKIYDIDFESESLDAGEIKWYYFDTIKGMWYTISWDDADSYKKTGAYNGDIVVSAFRSDRATPYFLNREYPDGFTALAAEEVYLKVEGDPDTASHAGSHSISVEERERENYFFLSAWDENGQFNFPADIAIDTHRAYVYITDTINHRVQKFDRFGNFILSWGSEGSGKGQFRHPAGIVVSPGVTGKYIYVIDTYNSRVQKFEEDGTFVKSWGGEGFNNGRFLHPLGIAIDSNWDIYVADSGNNRIQKFDHIGNFITSWGSKGTGNGQFDNPREITVDSKGFVYVSDTGNHRIQKFGR